ncbi:hypothetical protein [Bacillus testis]|uniref:hypothetical protein n=1 Tax=Bacillus testis TaxID=1622072 RepID=UPI00067EE5C0|nr:hypothetical protein [Bacillus testis]
MIKGLKSVLVVVIGIPLAIVAYLFLTSIIESALTIFYGIIVIPLVLAMVYWFVFNLKDFVVSIFKKDKGVDKDGFTKF